MSFLSIAATMAVGLVCLVDALNTGTGRHRR